MRKAGKERTAAKKTPPRAVEQAPARKESRAKKKAPAGKAAGRKRGGAKPTRRKRPERTVPEEPGLPLKEVRARLGLIAPQIAELEWIDGLYLYGAALMEEARLERVDFIVVYRGLRSTSRLRAAETELRELITAVLPVEFDLKLTGTLEIGRLLSEGNPAAQALLGYAETIFSRAG